MESIGYSLTGPEYRSLTIYEIRQKGARRNFEILTGACEKGGKIKIFASVFKGSASLRHRLSRFVAGFRRWFPTIGERRIMLPWDWLPQQ